METIITVLDYVGRVTTIIVVIGALGAIIIWLKGISPVLFRLGNGLAKRKIALFAKGDNLISLINLLCDSKLFKKKNIIEVTKAEDIGRAEASTLYLVFWHDWVDEIDEILQQKNDGTALIVYAPRERGSLPDDAMKKLDKKRNVTLSNFRGRLLNDIVVSMITTSYEK